MLDAAKMPLDALPVLNAMPGSYLILLPDAPIFTIVGASDAYLADTYLKRKEAIGHSVFEMLPDNPNDSEATGVKNLTASLCSVVESKKEHHMADQRYDVLNPRSSEWETRLWKSLNKPVLNGTGQVQYIIHWVEDITKKVKLELEAKRAEAKVREKDESLRNILYHAPVAMFIFRGRDMVIDTINKKALEMIRRTEEVIGKPLLEAIPELSRSSAYDVFQEVYHTGIAQYGREVLVPLEQNGELKDRYFNFSYTPLREHGEVVGVMDVATEVTEQVVARQKIEALQQETEKQKRLYEAITNNTLDLLYIFDLNYHFIYANEALLNMWGQPKDGWLNKGLRELGYEDWHARLHEQEIDQIVITKKPVRGVVSFPHTKQGKRIYDYLLVPVLNEKGEVEAIAGTTRDITEIKQAEALLEAKVKERTQELENLNRELKRSNINLEEFAYVASHDLKEPLRKMQVFLDRLKEGLIPRLREEEFGLLQRIEKAGERLTLLVDDLLEYSHVSIRPRQLEEVDLSEKVKRVLEDLELTIQEKKAVIQVEPLPAIYGHRRQLQQLFQNLLSNALKYSRKEVIPSIQITCKKVKGEEISTNIPEGEKIKDFYLIEVKDNGIGFEQEYAERIFQVFQRLHGRSEYSGTGVGLAIVRKVVENHGGYIMAESLPGKGSSFKVFFPVP